MMCIYTYPHCRFLQTAVNFARVKMKSAFTLLALLALIGYAAAVQSPYTSVYDQGYKPRREKHINGKLTAFSALGQNTVVATTTCL